MNYRWVRGSECDRNSDQQGIKSTTGKKTKCHMRKKCLCMYLEENTKEKNNSEEQAAVRKKTTSFAKDLQ